MQLPTPPPGPSWVRPSPPASWTIEFKYPNPDAKDNSAEGRPTKVAVSVTGKVSLESIRCTKSKYDIWISQGSAYIADPETGAIGLRYSSASMEGTRELAPQHQDWAGLHEFEWIKPDLFQGTIKQGEEVLHVYAELPEDMLAARRPPGSAAPGAPTGARPPTAARTAQKWPPGPIGGLPLRPDIKVVAVNAETHYPHFLQLGETLREYVFSPSSNNSLELPSPIVKALKMYGR